MRPSMATLAVVLALACSSRTPPRTPIPDAGAANLGAVYHFYLGPPADVRFVYAQDGTWKSGAIPGSDNTSKPAVVKNPAGSIYVVVTSAKGEVLFTRSKTPAFPAWTNLGLGASNLKTGPFFDLPGVGLNADGRVELFLVGLDGKVHHAAETAPDSGDFGPWSILDDVSSPAWPAHPVAARNADGRLELFEVGAVGTVFHKWQESRNSSAWSSDLRWDSFGRPTSVHLLPGTIAVGTLDDGSLEFFVEGSAIGSHAVHLFHVWQTVPGEGWSGWENLHLTATTPSRPAVALDRFGTDGYQYLFVQQGRSLRYKRQLVTNGRWSDWSALEGTWLAAVSVLHADAAIYIFESKGASGYYNKSRLNALDDAGTPSEYPGQSWPEGWKQLY
jgi:hypothetical protein